MAIRVTHVDHFQFLSIFIFVYTSTKKVDKGASANSGYREGRVDRNRTVLLWFAFVDGWRFTLANPGVALSSKVNIFKKLPFNVSG